MDHKNFLLLWWIGGQSLKVKGLFFIFVLLLTSCTQMNQKQEKQQAKETVNVMKEDLQITAFHIKTAEKKLNYTVFYEISDSLYKKLEKEGTYYFQIIFPEKVQTVIGKERSEIVKGEKVREGYKEYELNIQVPVKHVSTSQLKALESYYEKYDLQMLNHEKIKVGEFQNMIQIVKDYGEKKALQP